MDIGISIVSSLLPQVETSTGKCLNTPIEVFNKLELHSAAEAGNIISLFCPEPKIRRVTSSYNGIVNTGVSERTSGVLVNQLRLFRLAVFLNGAGGAASAPNARNLYFSAFFPRISLIDQFFSFYLGANDFIRIRQIKFFDPEDIVAYLDVNFYLRQNEANGTIDETVTSYQFGVNGMKDIYFAYSRFIVEGQNVIVRNIPIEWMSYPISIMYRLSQGNSGRSINLNSYFRIDYFRGGVSAPYHSLADAPSNSPFFTPLKQNYPINNTARAVYQAYVATFQIVPYIQQTIYPYFGFLDGGNAIDCGYKALQTSTNILFDTRACTYFTSVYFTVQPNDEIYIIQYNHKREAGRCRYGSITIYDENQLRIVFSSLTIPENIIPINDYLLCVYRNDFPDQRNIIVGERIYQYPAPAYTNTEYMNVFLKPFTP